MLKFNLNPPSGFAYSYQDIRFDITFQQAFRAEIRFFNDTVKQPLDIVSVSSGRIIEEKTIVVQSTSSVNGYINLFNKDKLNVSLANYTSVNIRCEADIWSDESNKQTYEMTTAFYNESRSLDYSVIPFDLILHSPEIDSSTPLKISLICDHNNRFELAIKNKSGSKSCIFEVVTKKGRTTVEVPAAVLYHDLQIKDILSDFNIYWTKFEGLDYSKFMQRKSILIPNTEIKFKTAEMRLLPQNRLGPISELSDDFVLSDRYFVHTYKSFSGLGEKTLSPIRMKRLTFFMHEAQAVQSLSSNFSTLDAHNNLFSEAQNTIRQSSLKKQPIRILGVSKQNSFLETFSDSYAKRIVDAMPMSSPSVARTISPLSQKQSTGCASCGRKKK